MSSFIYINSVYGELFPTPKISSGEMAIYNLKDKSKPDYDILSSNREAKKESEKGAIHYRLHKVSKNGKNIFEYNISKHEDRTKIETNIIMEATEYVNPISFHQITYDEKGRIIRNYNAIFAGDIGSLPKDAYQREAFPFLLRGLKFKEGEKHGFHLWNLEETLFVALIAKFDKKEKIKVPAGEFQCYKIDIILDVKQHIGEILTPIATPFLPKYSFWFTESDPHFFVKYEGPIGPPSSPVVISELININFIQNDE